MTSSKNYQLSQLEEDFLRSKILSDTKTADEWLSFFNKIANIETFFEDAVEYYNKLQKIGLSLILVGVLTIIFAVTLRSGVLVLFGVILFIVGIIWAIVYYFKKSDLTTFRVDRYFIEQKILPIIYILREEMKKSDQISLNINLGCFYHNGEILQYSERVSDSLSILDAGAPAEPNSLGFHDGIYKDSWFYGEAKFTDGVNLNWNIFDMVKFSEEITQKRRGLKWKWRSRYKTIVGMNVSMPKKRYELPDKTKQKTAEGNFQVKKSGKYYLLDIERKFDKTDFFKITSRTGYFECENTGKTFEAKNFVDVLAVAYKLAKPVAGQK